MENIFKKWNSFLISERNYTPDELSADPLWSDLSLEEIDGFFWNAAGDGTLDALTKLIGDLADESGVNIRTEEEWKEFRDEAMQHADISAAYDNMAPESESAIEVATDPGSPGAAARQAARREEGLREKAVRLISDALRDLQEKYPDTNQEEILRIFKDTLDDESFVV